SASLSPVGDLGYSAIDQIAQFGLSSLKVIYYSEQLFSENGETFKGVTDNQGLCKRVFSKESAKLTVWLGVLALERW
ncbi:hypothetical protein P8V84_17785, partial [Klebsiella pneumoniae]|nr:hypothetical protein [Klebsiella pneumoniae]